MIIWDRLKYVYRAIYNLRLRRRLEATEIIKNHIISKRLCNHYISKINNASKVTVEAHLGSDPEYKWIPLTLQKEGIINIPRLNSFSTRLLPIICHEASHPIIALNTNLILQGNTYKEAFQSIHDFVLKHFQFLRLEDPENISQTYASSIFSEILADIFSVLICSHSYLWAFSSSELWPWDRINAKDWMVYGYWTSHPPNEFRFRVCNEVLNIINRRQARLLARNWRTISSLQNNFPDNIFIIALKAFSDDLYNELKIRDLVNEIRNDRSIIYIDPYRGGIKSLDDITEADEPIDILNAIWETRYNRFINGIDLDDRKTTKALKTLYYSLALRRQ